MEDRTIVLLGGAPGEISRSVDSAAEGLGMRTRPSSTYSGQAPAIWVDYVYPDIRVVEETAKATQQRMAPFDRQLVLVPDRHRDHILHNEVERIIGPRASALFFERLSDLRPELTRMLAGQRRDQAGGRIGRGAAAAAAERGVRDLLLDSHRFLLILAHGPAETAPGQLSKDLFDSIQHALAGRALLKHGISKQEEPLTDGKLAPLRPPADSDASDIIWFDLSTNADDFDLSSLTTAWQLLRSCAVGIRSKLVAVVALERQDDCGARFAKIVDAAPYDHTGRILLLPRLELPSWRDIADELVELGYAPERARAQSRVLIEQNHHLPALQDSLLSLAGSKLP